MEPPLPKKRQERMKLVKLANFKPVRKPMKHGTWPTWPTFCRCCWWDFEDLSHPTNLEQNWHSEWNLALPKTNAGTGEVGQVGQLQNLENPTKQGTWPTFLVITVSQLDAGAKDRSDSIGMLAPALFFGIEKVIHLESS